LPPSPRKLWVILYSVGGGGGGEKEEEEMMNDNDLKNEI